MTLNIRGYEVEIKAKGEYSKRFNQADTMALLNEMSCYMNEAANMYQQRGMGALENNAREMRNNIFNTLDTKGYYDDVRSGQN